MKADLEVKEGQIAHLDRNPSNNNPDNLAWLCLSHHDHYDSVRRQTKRLTPDEVKSYRALLHNQLSALMSRDTGEGGQADEEEKDTALEVFHRYSQADKSVTKVIAQEIVSRIERIYQFGHAYEAALVLIARENLTDVQEEVRCNAVDREIHEKLGMPDGIWGLHSDGPLPSSWRKDAERLAKKWNKGLLSYDECINMLWVFDEECDTDLHYVLFGLPNRSLSPLQRRALLAFIFEHGQREFISQSPLADRDVPF